MIAVVKCSELAVDGLFPNRKSSLSLSQSSSDTSQYRLRSAPEHCDRVITFPAGDVVTFPDRDGVTFPDDVILADVDPPVD